MIEMYKFKDVDLRGATIIDGFPTVGLVSTIIANYLIETLNLDQICAIDSPDFPPVSMIYASKPKFPARIYADEDNKIAVFLSEFTPTPSIARPIADKILSWAIENKCKRIVTPEGLALPKSEEGSEKEFVVYGVGSNTSARKYLEKLGVKQLGTGIITGVSGVLLNEGRRNDFEVISLLSEVHPDFPDARAAAKIMEILDKLIKKVKIDPKPLYLEAEKIEGYIKKLRKQADQSGSGMPTRMYG